MSLGVEERLASLQDLKKAYEKQIKNLKESWENGTSGVTDIKYLNIQLDIWEKRVKQYQKDIDSIQGK